MSFVRVASQREDKAIVRIPMLGSTAVVVIQVQPTAVRIEIEQARTAISAALYEMPSVSPPIEGLMPISRLNSMWDLKLTQVVLILQHFVPSITNYVVFVRPP